jgi:ketosteroid isomerase-like protein
MSRLSTWVMLAVVLASPGASQNDVRRAIQAQYDRWSRAYMANDVDALLDILSPDYTLTSADKDVMSYATYKAYLQLKKKGPKETTRYSTRIVKLTLQKGDAKVDSIETMLTWKPDPSGHVIESTHRHEYLDVWRRAGSSWRLRSTMTLRESTTVKRRG